MKVVIDASPLISFAVIDQLELLKKLFPKIIVPQAVQQEIMKSANKKETAKIEYFIKDWICHSTEEDKLLVNLGRGETEAINLTLELRADLLIIDDKKARNAAESYNIKCIGTLGLLTLAKKKGFVKELRKYFIQLVERQRYFSTELLNQILQANQERPL